MGIIANDTTYIDTSIDSGFDPITDYSPQLAPSGIYIGYPYIFLIQPEIGNLGASAKIAPFTNNAVTDIIMVGNFTPLHNYGILNLHSTADMTIITNRGIGANVAIWSNVTILPN